jgi:hypothetical protein
MVDLLVYTNHRMGDMYYNNSYRYRYRIATNYQYKHKHCTVYSVTCHSLHAPCNEEEPKQKKNLKEPIPKERNNKLVEVDIEDWSGHTQFTESICW